MKNNFYFIILILTYVSIWLSKTVLETDELLINYFSTKFSPEQAEKFVLSQNKWVWINYLVLPVFLALKISLISSILYIGCYFFGVKITFRRNFIIVSQAEILFVLIGFIKIFWFYFFQTNFSFEDIQYFYPFSALNIVGYRGLDPWFIYPLQVLNLFELAYWFVLAYLLGKELNISMDKGFKIVASSYGPALAIWVVAVMFFTLNYS